MKINLGSGNLRREGWVNVDRLACVNPDIVCDITKMPWPWDESVAERIDADNLLEHVGWGSDGEDLLMVVMNEAHRILIPGGVMWFRVPDFERWPVGALRDPTHRRYFVKGSMDYWTADHPTHHNYGKFYGYKPWGVRVKLYTPGAGRSFLDVTQIPIK